MKRIAFLVITAGALLMACGRGQTEGQIQVDKLTTEIDSLVRVLEKGRAELTATLAAHHEVIHNQEGDLLDPFKRFNSGLADMEKRREQVRGQVENVRAAAQPFFETWSKNLEKFNSEEMKNRSRERMEQTRQRYEEIRRNGEEARNAYDMLMPMLRDHALFLSSDLNADSARALAKDDEKIKRQADSLLRNIDEVIVGSKRYNEAVAMRTQPPS